MIDLKGVSSAAAGIPGAGGKTKATAGSGFGEVFSRAIDAVNAQSKEAEQSVVGLVSGENGNIHETMIAMEKSSISFRLLTRAQNKVLDAYQEIMRLQL